MCKLYESRSCKHQAISNLVTNFSPPSLSASPSPSRRRFVSVHLAILFPPASHSLSFAAHYLSPLASRTQVNVVDQSGGTRKSLVLR
ncbi:hypothetical protein ACOSQ3_023507 [Xanthoceras sorbifolium]